MDHRPRRTVRSDVGTCTAVQVLAAGGLVVLGWGGGAWSAPVRELVVLVGLLHVGGVLNLLPALGMDGATGLPSRCG